MGRGFGVGLLPVTRSGKLDRRALLQMAQLPPPPPPPPAAGAWKQERAADEFSLPRRPEHQELELDTIQQALEVAEQDLNEDGGWMRECLQVWANEVPVPCASTRRGGGRKIHFTRLGGDSLAAMRSCKELSEAYNTAVAVTALHPTSQSEPTDAHNVVGQAEAGEFGEGLAGPFAAIELLRRPRLSDYATWMYQSLGAWPACQMKQGLPAGGGRKVALDGEALRQRELHKEKEREIATASALLYQAAAAPGQGVGRMIRWLLEHCETLSVDGLDGMSPLHVACLNGQVDALTSLLAAGARLTAGTKDGVLPIHFASQCTRGAAALRSLATSLLPHFCHQPCQPLSCT
jgi:hypothetical protein